MSVYRTEIEIPADRFVCLQLPTDLPEGRAIVTVQFLSTIPQVEPMSDPDRDDIEWWEEFDEAEEPFS